MIVIKEKNMYFYIHYVINQDVSSSISPVFLLLSEVQEGVYDLALRRI